MSRSSSSNCTWRGAGRGCRWPAAGPAAGRAVPQAPDGGSLLGPQRGRPGRDRRAAPAAPAADAAGWTRRGRGSPGSSCVCWGRGSAGAPDTLVAALGRAPVEAGGDHGDPHLVAQRVVDGGAEDDVGLRVHRLGDQCGRLVDLEEPEVGAAGDREQHAVGAVDRGLEQRAGDRHLGGSDRAVLAPGRADAHQRRAGVGHHRLHVGEVEVDQAGGGDQVGDAGDALQEHLVGLLEGVEDRDVAVADREQPVVGDDDEGVDLLAQLRDALLRGAWPATALEGERAGDHADGQGAERAGDPGDDRGATGAGATALAGGHEHHVGALDDLLDLLGVVLGGTRPDVGVGPGAETAGELAADVELDVGVTT